MQRWSAAPVPRRNSRNFSADCGKKRIPGGFCKGYRKPEAIHQSDNTVSPSRPIPAGKGKRLHLRTEWKKGEFWTPENPKLYRLVFSVFRDGVLLDQVSDRFGFRELTVRGSEFLLNGVPRRLKFFSNQADYTKWNDETIRDFFLLLKEMHFNGIIFQSLDRRVVRIANELGVMIAMRDVLPKLVRNGVYLPGVDNIGYPSEIYLSGKLLPARREFERTIRGIVSKFRNDPSIVIWAINPLLCYNPEWINPNEIDRERAQNDLTTATLLQEAWLRSLDPSRLVLQSMGSNTGAIIAVNPYPTFSNPIEEWENWPMRWLRDFLYESREGILHSAAETAQPTGAKIAISKKSIRCTKNRKEIIL